MIFGTPVYAGRVPNLLLPYIRDKVKGNGALASAGVLCSATGILTTG